jgi:predicted GNAT family acetyltransferase
MTASATRTLAGIGDAARGDLQRLVDTDPIANAVLASRLAVAPSLDPRQFGGALLGVRERQALVAGLFIGGNVLPVGGDESAWRQLGSYCVERARVCTSMVGPADAIDTLWRAVAPAWGPCRDYRRDQPLLLTDRRPGPHIARHPGVRPARPDDLPRYLPAAVAMFTEELGASPLYGGAADPYRRRIDDILRSGRGFLVADVSGEVVFKTDIGALTRHTCQLQGVWVRPDARGRGLATTALAAVIDHALRLAPTVSLYVNGFNTAARRVYDSLGFRQVGTLATVLF